MDWKRIFAKWLNALPWLVVVIVIVLLLILHNPLPVIKDWKPITDLINALSWPVVAVVFLLAFRKPLAALIAGLSGRVTKLSAFQISIELVALPAPPSPWSDPKIYKASEMTNGGEVTSTTFMDLFTKIKTETPWDYLIVDIKDGHFWFISRVFIFTVFLQAMRGMKCVVFVESKGDRHHHLIGLASPDAVRATLSEKYSWLEQALSNAMIQYHTTFLNPSIDPSTAGNIIQSFLQGQQMRQPQQPDDKWTQLGSQPLWEHTEWLDGDKINDYLRPRKVLYEWDSSTYEDTPDIQTDKRTRELVCRKAPFIALVNSKAEFQSLLERQKLLELLVPLLQNE